LGNETGAGVRNLLYWEWGWGLRGGAGGGCGIPCVVISRALYIVVRYEGGDRDL
jgi:hypothetical protein